MNSERDTLIEKIYTLLEFPVHTGRLYFSGVEAWPH